MRDSLLRLAAAESTFYARHGTYTSFLDSLRVKGKPLSWAADVRLVIARADSGGWRAIASNTWTEDVCRLARGAPGPVAPGEEPECP